MDELWRDHPYASGIGLTKANGRFAAGVCLVDEADRPREDFAATTRGGLPIVYLVIGQVVALARDASRPCDPGKPR